MIDIEQSLIERIPWLNNRSVLVRKPTFELLRKLINEAEINDFLERYRSLKNFEFIDQVFEYLNFNYSLSRKSRANIPAEGRVVIVANHPIGSLDGLALLRAVGEVRSDVKIVANSLLMSCEQIRELLIPLDNMGGRGYRECYRQVMQALTQEQAVIVFPAGEVSRMSASGIRDGKWQTGFLHFARKSGANILPVHIDAKNSALFYSLSAIYKPLSTLWLTREMFNKKHTDIHFVVGDPILASALQSELVGDRFLCKRFRRYLYKLGRGKARGFVTEKTVAHREPAQAVKAGLDSAQRLGDTRDGKTIYLCDYQEDSSLFRELGRLREKTFRRVGEGTGSRRDLDSYDRSYRHLILWDKHAFEIAGAYRFGDCRRLLAERGISALYTNELFDYQSAALPLLEQAIELGRSFVSPEYWGKNSLDYLWQGLGAMLTNRPDIRYLVGPVSMSADIPHYLRDRLVHHYCHFHASEGPLAFSRSPYRISASTQYALDQELSECDRETSFRRLQAAFIQAGCKLPVLFKQYAALFEEGGFTLMDFGVDGDFGACIDGLFIADLQKLKATKRHRYLVSLPSKT